MSNVGDTVQVSTETNAVGTKATEPNAVETKAVGTNAVGTKATEPKAVGTNEVGTEAIGTEEIGTASVGTKAVGTKAVGPSFIQFRVHNPPNQLEYDLVQESDHSKTRFMNRTTQDFIELSQFAINQMNVTKRLVRGITGYTSGACPMILWTCNSAQFSAVRVGIHDEFESKSETRDANCNLHVGNKIINHNFKVTIQKNH